MAVKTQGSLADTAVSLQMIRLKLKGSSMCMFIPDQETR